MQMGMPASARSPALPIRFLTGLLFAAAMLGLPHAPPARAQTVVPPSSGPCVVAGTTATCTGDVSAGVDADGPAIDTLNINSLTQNLGNTGNADAINFAVNGGNVTVNLNTGGFETVIATGISTTDGIDATVTGNGNVTVNSTGNFTNSTLGNGILGNVSGNGNVTIVSEGNITARGIGINAIVGDAGDATVQSTGNITINSPITVVPPTRPAAIRAAVTNAGNVRIVSTGDISIAGGSIASGIQANEFLGLVTARTVTIISTGNITASGGSNSFGIQAGHDIGPTNITSRGNISAANGISVIMGTSGDIVIETTGDITGTNEGIAATTPSGKSFVSIAGTVTGGGGTAINLTATPGVAELALRAGWGLSGQARTVTTDTDDILSLGGTTDSNLDLAQIGDATNPNAILGFDNLVKEDSSTWTLTGTQTTGNLVSTSVNAGTLINNGTLLSPVTVNSAIYGGTGSSNSLTVNSGGTVKPGMDGIGTLTVNGNLTFNNGSIFQVDLNETGATDLIAATGQATISTSGTTINVIANPAATFPATSPVYTVISAPGGVTGQFAGLTDNLPDLAFIATYPGTTVNLSYASVQSGASTNVGGVPEFTPKEIHPSALAAAMHSNWLFVDTLSRRVGLSMPQLSDTPEETQVLGYAGKADGLKSDRRGKGVWGAVMGEYTRVDTTDDVTGWDARIGGLAFGLEKRLDGGSLTADWPPLLVGLAGGYTKTDVDSDTSGADLESFHAGLYAASRMGALTVSGALAAAHQSYDISRAIDLGSAGGSMIATGEPDGYSVTSSLEATYDFNRAFSLFENGASGGNNLRFGPVLSLDILHGQMESFTEANAGLLNLAVEQTSGTQAISGVGLAAELTRAVGTHHFTLEGRLAWEHVFGDRSIVTNSAIAAFTAASFSTGSAEMDANRITVGAGGALQISDTLSAHIRYDGRFSTNTMDHRGSAGLTFRF